MLPSMIEKFLRDLVALPSVNPAFLPVGHPRAGEKNVGDFLAATAARAGLDVAFQRVLPDRSNLLVTLRPSARPRRRILLAPHLDTVSALDTQFQPRISHGRLYGRGACDTKGSVAAMLGALINLARSGRRPAETEIVFAGLVDEEIGHAGADALVRDKWKADLAIIGEPTRLKVVTAHKGAAWFEARTKGKAAHGSCPERGRNAVHEMAKIVDVLETEYADKLRQRPAHPLLGRGTVNVGSIHGGAETNIVPASCIATIDRRTLPGETMRGVRAEIQSLLRPRGLRAELRPIQALDFRAMETDFNLPAVRQFSRLVGQKKPLGVTYFCDGAVLSGGGIPSLVFGPGDIAQAHTIDEWISLASLAQAERLLRRFFEQLS